MRVTNPTRDIKAAQALMLSSRGLEGADAFVLARVCVRNYANVHSCASSCMHKYKIQSVHAHISLHSEVHDPFVYLLHLCVDLRVGHDT